MTELFGLLLDVTILCLLVATVYYAIKLSTRLKVFRESRAEIANLLEDLSNNITHAEQATAGLREAAKESGKELQDTINKARALSDELQFINEAGDNLAKRLEKLASQGRSATVRESDEGDEDRYFADAGLEEIFRKPERKAADVPPPSRPATRPSAEPLGFAIRDPDYDLGEEPDEIGIEDYMGAGDDAGGLATRAERDLYSALVKNRKKKAGKK